MAFSPNRERGNSLVFSPPFSILVACMGAATTMMLGLRLAVVVATLDRPSVPDAGMEALRDAAPDAFQTIEAMTPESEHWFDMTLSVEQHGDTLPQINNVVVLAPESFDLVFFFAGPAFVDVRSELNPVPPQPSISEFVNSFPAEWQLIDSHFGNSTGLWPDPKAFQRWYYAHRYDHRCTTAEAIPEGIVCRRYVNMIGDPSVGADGQSPDLYIPLPKMQGQVVRLTYRGGTYAAPSETRLVGVLDLKFQ